MDEIIKTLQYLELNGEVDKVDNSSYLDIQVVKELEEAGLVEAINVSNLDETAYLKVRINIRGREWLKEQLISEAPALKEASDDIVEVKPNFMGIGLNLNAMWKKWFKRKT